MKKIFNTILACGFLAAVCAMFSSCIILLDDETLDECGITVEAGNYWDYSVVTVDNLCSKYGSDAAYISTVYYKSYSTDEWQIAWDCTDSCDPLYADNNCSFRLDSGRYYFCVRVVYPNMSSVYDYYDDYYSDTRYYCAEGSTLKLEFDGDYLYRQ